MKEVEAAVAQPVPCVDERATEEEIVIKIFKPFSRISTLTIC